MEVVVIFGVVVVVVLEVVILFQVVVIVVIVVVMLVIVVVVRKSLVLGIQGCHTRWISGSHERRKKIKDQGIKIIWQFIILPKYTSRLGCIFIVS